MHIVTLEYERGKEKVSVHYKGDASKLITINRGGILLDTAEQIDSLVKLVSSGKSSILQGNQEIIDISNRFTVPSSTGYRDIKIYIRDNNGFISTLRAASRPFERSTFFMSSDNEWKTAMIVANTLVGSQGCSWPFVLIKDNYLRDEYDSIHLVSGFASIKDAYLYGLSRVNGTLVEIKKFSPTAQDLIDNWILFGEGAAVVSQEGVSPLDQAIEARLIDSDISGLPRWRSDEGKNYFKAPILLD